ncbi:hypothetical protein FSP39_010684, partial [Pinctada imbricata]
YYGCYPETPESRQFGANPGNYNPATINPTHCENLCGNRGYPYAGLTAGKVCLCGRVITQGAVADPLCSQPCPGDTSHTCGSPTQPWYVSVYSTPTILTGFGILQPGVIETYFDTTVHLNLTSGEVAEINGQFYDGGPKFGPITDLFTAVSPRKPGLVPFEAQIRDTWNVSASAVAVIKVENRVRLLDLTCPDTIIAEVRFDCYLTVGVGTNMAASIDMGDGTVIPIRLPDTQGFTTGSLIGPEVAVNSPANTLILMPEHFLKSNGTIVGIDYIAASAGDISLQIYRPSCADPTLSFCHNSYSCMPSGESCMAQPRGIKWRHACGTTAIYNLARRKCVDRTTNQIIPDPITQNWASVEFHRYDLVKEIEFTIPNMGRHFFAVPDEELFTLTAGDVLAIHESSGRLKLLDATSKNYEFYWDMSGDSNFASRSTSGYVISDSSTPSVLSAQHALQVYYTRPVRGKIRHTYAAATNLDHYNVTASVSNNVTIPAATVEKTINVQVPITGLDVLLPQYVPTNATIQFNVTDHVGSEPVYTWVYGDGEMNVTSSKSVEKTYTVAGVYTVTLSAHNEISSQTIERVIVIQDLILNFTVEMETMATVYTKPTTINFSILQGTNVSYTCNMGDGHVYTFDFPFSGYLSNDTDKIINGTNITETVYFMNGTSNGKLRQ